MSKTSVHSKLACLKVWLEQLNKNKKPANTDKNFKKEEKYNKK